MVFEEKHHMLWAYEAYEEKSQIHRKNVALGNVGESSSADSFHRRGLLPPLRRSPSLEEGGLGVSPVKACGLAVDWI